MIVLEIDEKFPERIVVHHLEYELDLVKEIPGYLFKQGRSTIPLSWASVQAARGVLADLLDVGPQLRAWSWSEWENRVQPSLEVRHLTDPDRVWPKWKETIPSPALSVLRPAQKIGAGWLALNEQALLGDDMGTGKTVQAISAVLTLDEQDRSPFPVVVICPNSVKSNWRAEWNKWSPDTTVTLVSGTAAQRRKQLQTHSDVYILNWEALRSHSRLAPYGSMAFRKCADHRGGDDMINKTKCEMCDRELNEMEYNTVIVDEIHGMKNPKAKQTRAAWKVMHKAQFRFGLSGTPLANTPKDIWPIMHGLVPEEYPTNSSFIDRYCDQKFSFLSGQWEVKGIKSDTKDEFYRFFDARYRRMPKELVLNDLPPRVWERREAPLSPKQMRAYKELVKHNFTEDENGHFIIAQNDLESAIRLLQYTAATCEVDDLGQIQLVKPSPKISVLFELLEEATGSVAVATESRKFAELIAESLDEAGIKFGMIVGGMTDDQRDAVMRDFDRGDIEVLLFTMRAGGIGLNMTKANTLIRMERSWSMLINEQTLGRVQRIGSEQHDSITIIDVVAPNTIEARQERAVKWKHDCLEEIRRDKAALLEAEKSTKDLDQAEQQILEGDINIDLNITE